MTTESRSWLTETDCERLGATSLADISHDEIQWLHHHGGKTLGKIAEVATSQEPPNVAMLGLLKAVCSRQEANAREYGYGARLKEALNDTQELSEVIDAHIRQAEQEAGQQG
jgi:phosphopentomutase